MGVARLLSQTETLESPRIFERSIKLSQSGISTDRGLVSLDKSALYPGPKGTMHEMCLALGCPDPSPLDPYLGQASAVHFGADEDIGKCYLEFPRHDRPEDNLVFLALKWKGSDQRLNRYTELAGRSHQEKEAFIDELVPDPTVADVMRRSLALARDGDPDGEAVALYVTEEGTSRASIDISVADAKSSVADAMDVLAPLKAFNGCDVRHVFDGIRGERFGHVAAGVDRQGATFVTVYYGAELI